MEKRNKIIMLIKTNFNIKLLLNEQSKIDISSIINAPIVINNKVFGAIKEYNPETGEAEGWLTGNFNLCPDGKIIYSLELI